ncbi:MAG: hypothetical protein IIA45_14205 [Bacteroidetes bacterium]|nr:hypothetical protein [Bacteroidota bacterium]
MTILTKSAIGQKSGLVATDVPDGYTVHTEFGCTTRDVTPGTFLKRVGGDVRDKFEGREMKMVKAPKVGLKWFEKGVDITTKIFNGHREKYKDYYILVSREKLG